MKSLRFKRLVVTYSLIALMLGPQAFAAPITATTDIALLPGGVFQGQILDVQGKPISNAPVSILVGKREISRSLTDKAGQFQFRNLKGGVYQVVTPGHNKVYRCWAPRTAPPVARQGLLVVVDQDVVRAQGCDCGAPVKCGSGCGCGGGGLIGWMADHPIITAGAIGTAIAIPLATEDDEPASP